MPRGDRYAVPQTALGPHCEVQPLQHLGEERVRHSSLRKSEEECSALQAVSCIEWSEHSM